jgi:hypothetical protein
VLPDLTAALMMAVSMLNDARAGMDSEGEERMDKWLPDIEQVLERAKLLTAEDTKEADRNVG